MSRRARVATLLLGIVLVAIALYPDPLVAQTLMASTYPLEVIEAARFAKASASLKGAALNEALKSQAWAESLRVGGHDPVLDPVVTILTKCPAPFVPQWRYPRSAVPPTVSRPGVRAIVPAPGASVAKIGSSRFTTASSPPIIRQYPRSRPQTPPLVPTST